MPKVLPVIAVVLALPDELVGFDFCRFEVEVALSEVEEAVALDKDEDHGVRAAGLVTV